MKREQLNKQITRLYFCWLATGDIDYWLAYKKLRWERAAQDHWKARRLMNLYGGKR